LDQSVALAEELGRLECSIITRSFRDRRRQLFSSAAAYVPEGRSGSVGVKTGQPRLALP
jgi:hypothetical protein